MTDLYRCISRPVVQNRTGGDKNRDSREGGVNFLSSSHFQRESWASTLDLPQTTLQRTATHCNSTLDLPQTKLQHTATHCNSTLDLPQTTLQHTATHYNSTLDLPQSTLQHTTTHCNSTLDLPQTTLQHTATHCNCNTLQQHIRSTTTKKGISYSFL